MFLIALTPAGSAREGDGDAAAHGQGTQQGTGNLLCHLLLSMLSTHRAIRTLFLHVVYGTRYWIDFAADSVLDFLIHGLNGLSPGETQPPS